MIKEKLEKFKEILKKKEGENNKKTIENMVMFVVILIITIVAINYIWSGDSKKNKTNNETNKKLATEKSNQGANNSYNNTNNINDSYDINNIETKLENILSNIKGVGNVRVLVTYSQTSQIIPMYDEDSSLSTTEEKDSRWRNTNCK